MPFQARGEERQAEALLTGKSEGGRGIAMRLVAVVLFGRAGVLLVGLLMICLLL